ncbi:MAG TPA: hypothetical protein VJ484_00935 [Lysobacter sp.]|nr:hypothetical protein [Lysobacter sp.]
MRILFAAGIVISLTGCGPRLTPEQEQAALAAFTTVHTVFQHPRCANCHIPADAPLVSDLSVPHPMSVARGPEGHGAVGLPCSTCHADKNPPASYGPHAPPGAPHWGLPPPDQKMAWIGLSPKESCAMIKDKKRNGDRDLAALLKHVSEDKLVLWGWDPGGMRAPVSVPHAQFVAAFKTWSDAGGPCPG